MESHSNQQNDKSDEARENRANEDIACGSCGKFEAHPFGEQWLCLDCYQESGSCCALEEKDGG